MLDDLTQTVSFYLESYMGSSLLGSYIWKVYPHRE
jgi:hypothetical protein